MARANLTLLLLAVTACGRPEIDQSAPDSEPGVAAGATTASRESPNIAPPAALDEPIEPDGDEEFLPLESALSPDSQYLADFRLMPGSRIAPVLRRVSDRQVLLQGDAVYIEGTDTPVGAARWESSDSVTFFLQPDSLLPRSRWVRYRTTVSRREWQVDTVTVP